MPLFPTPRGASAPSQPSTFYFHKQSLKTINTFNTTLWSNTTQTWSTTTQSEPRNAVKGTLAVWDFYTEPIFAGNTTFTGPLTFILYLVSSGNSGAATVITGTVSKVTSTGTVVPLAVASLSNTQIGTTISVYTLTIVSNTYQIEAGSNLDFTISINISKTTLQTISLYYDVPAYRSQVDLTFQARLVAVSFLTLDSTGTPNRFFSRNSTLTNRQVTLRATIFDAIGIYDISLANASIISPTGSAYLSSTPLSLIIGTPSSYAGTWSLNFTYAVADPSGNYRASLGILDNSGTTVSQQLSYDLYAIWRLSLQTFSSDPTALPVSGALVTVYSSGVPVFSGVSNSSAGIVPGSVLLRDNVSYYVTTLWRSMMVNQTTTFGLTSPTNLVLRLSVYTINFATAFRSSNGKLLTSQPSSFLLTSQVNGSTTSPSPAGTYFLPAGSYTISSVIWNGVDVTPAAGVSFNPRSGTPLIDLSIYNLTVLAVDQNGQAIQNAQVIVSRNGQTVAQGTTTSDGSLNLGSLPVGQYVVQVKSSSQSISSTISLTQDTSQKIQVVPSPTSSWLVQSWGWFVLVGAAVGSIISYRQISRSRLTLREEPFEYLTKITGGGFKDGDTILIVGDEATGKTTLCEQIAYRALISASPVVFLTYEGDEKVGESMKRHKWDPSPWEPGRFQLIPCETIRGSDLSYGMVENFYGITALNISMNNALEDAKPGKPLMIVDPLTSLAETASVSGLMSLLVEMSGKVKKLQGKLFLSIDQSIPKQALARIEEASDGVLSLNKVTENGKPAVDMHVKKMRGRQFLTTPVRVSVNEKKGITFRIKRSLPIKSKTPSTSHNESPRAGRSKIES